MADHGPVMSRKFHLARKHLLAKALAACLTAVFVLGGLMSPAGSASADPSAPPADQDASSLDSMALTYDCTWPGSTFHTGVVFHVPSTLVPDSTNDLTADVTFDQVGVEMLNLAGAGSVSVTVSAVLQRAGATPTAFVLGTTAVPASLTVKASSVPPLGSPYTFSAVPGAFATLAPALAGAQTLTAPAQLELQISGTTTPCVLDASSSPQMGEADVAELMPTIRTAATRSGLTVTALAAPGAPGVGRVAASTVEQITQTYTRKVWVKVRRRHPPKHGRRFRRVRRTKRFKRVVTRSFSTSGTLDAQGRVSLDLARLGLRQGTHRITIAWAGSTVVASYVMR